jgi:hypothetical protein
MTKPWKIGALVALALTLAACQTPAVYQPKVGSSTGYTDQQLSQNRFRVTFTGNSATSRETVENYLLLRAAQVTLQAGYTWFVFDTRDTEAKTAYHTDYFGDPFGPHFGPRFGWYWHDWDYDQADTTPVTHYDAYAEIVTLTPEQAKAEPRALNANDVVAHVGPLAQPPAHP